MLSKKKFRQKKFLLRKQFCKNKRNFSKIKILPKKIKKKIPKQNFCHKKFQTSFLARQGLGKVKARSIQGQGKVRARSGRDQGKVRERSR